MHHSAAAVSVAATLLLASTPLLADADPAQPGSDEPLDNVTIIGHRRDVRDVPGSAHIVDEAELERLKHADVMRVLRSVPGVYVQEEDGYGLRPNIGIRGSGLDRSARIALLEDGVLIAPAPYAASSAYYFPTQRRMHALEVLKGPAAVTVGPRTTGGAVNLISTPIPDDFSANGDLRLGQHDSLDAHVNVGDRGERFSWLVETVQTTTDGFKTINAPASGSTGFDIEDYLVKLQLDGDPAARLNHSLRLKAGYTNQVSDETYLGLTADDFAEDPYQRYAASAGDVFDGEHHQLQLAWLVDADGAWQGELTAYRNEFERDWFKLQSVGGVGIASIVDDPDTYATEYGWLTGTTSPDDALVKRHNAREYYSQGLQGSLSRGFELGGAELRLTGGFRVHEDEEDRLQAEDGFRMQDGELVLTSVGAPGSNTNRVSSADARSLFVSAEIDAGNWIFTPGLRYEDIDLVREDYATDDPTRANGPTRVRENSASVLIPGIGVLYRVSDRLRLLGGVHKGYNPPAPGSDAAEESSVNFEAGARYAAGALSLEGIWFYNDYDNLVGTVTASTGGGGQIGDQFDGGAVTVQGLELSASHTVAGISEYGLALPLRLEYTWTAEAEFRNGFESDFEPWGDVVVGDELPYIPEHQLRASAGLEQERFGVDLSASWVGRMRTVAGQDAYDPDETIDAHVVWDLVGRYRLSETLTGYVKVDNLFDETYVAARRPAGLRPGLERMAWLGLTFSL